VTLDAVNQMDCATFVATLGWVFEDSPWVAERAWRASPFASVAALHQAMVDAVSSAPAAEQVALIRAHPDLGTRARMSSASTGEQAGVGLDRLTLEEYQRLQRLNSTYREKFGFPFIYSVKGGATRAVKGSATRDILRALEVRLAGDSDTEFALALAQIYRIAQIRLEETLHA
jgi:2-oxo-4-hydroxy-4-carboxy-5-ureidoimidazoline decarboxylase